MKRHRLLVREEDGTLRELRSKYMLWYRLYVNTPPRNKRLSHQFRMRFRMPYDSFISLSNEIKHHDIFNRWLCRDGSGELPSNMKILLLGVLHYIGRACTLDDVEEANGISREVNRIFLNCFIEYGSTSILYKNGLLMHVSILLLLKWRYCSAWLDLMAA